MLSHTLLPDCSPRGRNPATGETFRAGDVTQQPTILRHPNRQIPSLLQSEITAHSQSSTAGELNLKPRLSGVGFITPHLPIVASRQHFDPGNPASEWLAVEVNDRDADPDETVNMAKANPALARHLITQLRAALLANDQQEAAPGE